MTTEPTAALLIDQVLAVPGVVGIEPGIGTSLRTLDARIRRTGAHAARFGLHIDRDHHIVTVEVCLDRRRAIRDTVRDIQHTLHRALSGTMTPATEWTVRVQSLEHPAPQGDDTTSALPAKTSMTHSAR